MTVLEKWHSGSKPDGRLILQRDPNGEAEIWLADPQGVLTFCHSNDMMPIIPVRDDAKFEDCFERFRTIWANVWLMAGSHS